MTEDQIPDFVDDILKIGCDICAIGTYGYVIGDADLPPARYELIRDELHRIEKIYGKRDHLKSRIIAHLREIGRVVELPTLK